jgi:methionine-rich copper-binding protein CopC
MTPKLALALAALTSLATAPAFAHAIVVASTPASGAVVAGPRQKIEIRFNSRIDSKRSRLELLRADGASVPLTAQEGANDRLAADAEGLEPGDYRLRWRTLSVDGHLTQGDIPFRVGR